MTLTLSPTTSMKSCSHWPNKFLGGRRKNNPWVTTEIMDLCYKRRELRHEKYTSLDSRTQYQKENREVKTKMKEAKVGCN
ncbi:hypothetical protein DPMN_067007 [Dreissena polymorpha]|uniref:Uncharacterized protein n=1 Tax=Dreissena polymorpha TaxID=45954 RepID=A0A9D4BTA6_DREPO|nr:hypothetical protein DPMN_067007 [Dreissena polymorpha]